MQNNQLKNRFTNDILASIEETKKLGYIPTRFIQMLQKKNMDAVALALELVPKGSTDGLTKMWQKGKLDLTLEAQIIKPEYRELFSQDIIEICERRLRKYGYKI